MVTLLKQDETCRPPFLSENRESLFCLAANTVKIGIIIIYLFFHHVLCLLLLLLYKYHKK